MSNTDKNILIVPNTGQTEEPKITFTGFDNNPITLNVLNDGTLSFEGSSGQLFSISDNLSTGTIFSVNDISGIPSIEVNADGTVSLAEFSGNVGVGTSSPAQKLDVVGNVRSSSQFISTVTTGTAPLSVASTTLVANLNADLLDGQEGTYYLDWANVTNKPDPVLTLSGDASGSATFTDLGNATLTVTVADDSHNHIIANVDGLQAALDAKVDENAPITGATNTKITYDSKGLVTSGTTLAATDIPNLDASKITSGTFAVARGGTGLASYTAGNYINAATSTTLQQRTPAQVLSDIGAAASSHTHDAAAVISGTFDIARIPTITAVKGGTGITAYTAGNYINAATSTTLQQRTPTQVLSDIGAAAASHTHAAGDVTSGTFADARISASSVQQHVTKTYVDGLNIDADTLDGIQGAGYVRSDVDDDITANHHMVNAAAHRYGGASGTPQFEIVYNSTTASLDFNFIG